MSIQLTGDLLNEIDSGSPVCLEDPRNHQQYVLVPREDYERFQSQHGPQDLVAPPPAESGQSGVTEWTQQKNARRGDLIRKDVEGQLTQEEAQELTHLQEEMLNYRRRVAPLPLDELRKLHAELLALAQQQQPH